MARPTVHHVLVGRASPVGLGALWRIEEAWRLGGVIPRDLLLASLIVRPLRVGPLSFILDVLSCTLLLLFLLTELEGEGAGLLLSHSIALPAGLLAGGLPIHTRSRVEGHILHFVGVPCALRFLLDLDHVADRLLQWQVRVCFGFATRGDLGSSFAAFRVG